MCILRYIMCREPCTLRPGFSGAELANVVNEAALLAGRRGQETVELAQLLEGVQRTKCALARWLGRRVSW